MEYSKNYIRRSYKGGWGHTKIVINYHCKYMVQIGCCGYELYNDTSPFQNNMGLPLYNYIQAFRLINVYNSLWFHRERIPY